MNNCTPQHGFSLIELIVGLVLSALLGTVLFNAFFQSNRTLRFVEEYAELDTGMAVILRQLERDLAGAIEPAYSKEQEEARQAQEKATADKEPKEQKEQKKEEKKGVKERKPSFIAKTKK